MAKINLVIADNDEIYLNRLGNYLIKKSETFNLSSFTSLEILCKHLGDPLNKVDILIIPVEFATGYIEEIPIPSKIILTEGEGVLPREGFELVNKYQKADKLLSDILLVHQDKTGSLNRLNKGSKRTKLVAVYSPVGGAGKTTIALALSVLCAVSGLKVFYLNLEKINSATMFFPPAPHGSISDVFLALKTKGANVGLKIKTNRYTDPNTKIDYFNQADSALEHNELSDHEVSQLLKEFEELGEYDLVLVDTLSAFDKSILNILTPCDQILVPITQDKLSLAKMILVGKELKCHERLDHMMPKIHLLANKVDAQGMALIQASGIEQIKPVEFYIPFLPALADVNNVAYIGNMTPSGLRDLVNLLLYR